MTCRDPKLIQSTAEYAYHIDAGLYAKFLRIYAEARGVTRREGKVVNAKLHHTTGFIESLKLADGSVIAADFFIEHYALAMKIGAIGCRVIAPLRCPQKNMASYCPIRNPSHTVLAGNGEFHCNIALVMATCIAIIL